MKVAFDLHGVLETNIEFFKPIIKVLKDFGVKVVILSGPPTKQIIEELHLLGYAPWYKYFFSVLSIVDFLREDTNVKMWQDDKGDWWTDEYNWWSSKGKICQKHSIDVLIDDRVEYFNHFDEDTKTNIKFILMNKERGLEFEKLAKTLIP